MAGRYALDAAVGLSDQYGFHPVLSTSLNLYYRTLRSNCAPTGRQRCCYESNVRTALVAARTTVVASAAVIAGRPPIPGQREGSATVGLPIEAEYRGAPSQCASSIRQRVGRQRKWSRAPTGPLRLWTGDPDEMLRALVVRFQFGVIDRPICCYAEPAVHFHGGRVNAMGLAGKMQGATANPSYVMVFLHPARVRCHHSPQASAARHQQRL